jgi:XRE family transcriptional regulator, thiamine biosynthesis regulator
MQPPCEIMMTDFLPNIRGVVSHELRDRGESQRRIAVLLGVTQARVSYYLSKKRSYFEQELAAKFGIGDNETRSYARALAEDVSKSQVDGIFTLYSIWKNFLFSGVVCRYHQEKSHVLNDCSVCMELHKPARDSLDLTAGESDDALVLKNISESVSMIEASPYFPYVMPEVSVNVAMARPNPRTVRDVAAVPGRIDKIHGRAKAFVSPEFGCSNHMSKVLLIVHAKSPAIRAALNLRYDSIIERALELSCIPMKVTPSERKIPRRRNEEYYSVSRKNSDDPVIARLEKTEFEQSSEKPVFAIIDKGSEGLEPMTYLFGQKATEIAEAATKVAHMYFNFQVKESDHKVRRN